MEVSDGVFNTYVILLAIAGIVMLVVACLPFAQGKASRIIGGLFGLGFLGYAIYLKFFFDGGSFAMFYYVFILPFIYVARVVKAYADRRRRQDAAMMPGYPASGYGQPGGFGQSGAMPPPAPGALRQDAPAPGSMPPPAPNAQAGSYGPPPPPA